MGSITNFLEDELNDHVCNAAFSPASGLFLALCTGDPLDTATGASMSEVANTNGYARTAISFAAAAGRAVVQSGAVTFPQASGSWGTISHWALVSSATHGAGDVYAHGSFQTAFTPVAGNTPTVPDGEVEIQGGASSGAGATNYLVHALLNLAFRNVAFSKPNTYIGLATAVIADDDVTLGDITECAAANNYSRKQVNPNGGATPTWDVSAGGIVDNTHDITFATPSGSWGAVTSMFIIDSASGAGNVLWYDNANIVDQTPVANDTVYFPAGALSLAIS